ncbi:hypothetical protein LBMAG43_20500 [Methylococcaceae bacterium]|nr:hypothetical protein LBMAG43_20500 [Methylococcaceae bacterium]
MIVTIEKADYLADYRLHLLFNTGESGDVDLKDLVFKYEIATPLRDVEKFKIFTLDEWATPTWNCGFDVSPEILYERATGKRINW